MPRHPCWPTFKVLSAMRDKWLRSIGAAVVLMGIGAFLIASISSNDGAQTETDREKQEVPYSVVKLFQFQMRSSWQVSTLPCPIQTCVNAWTGELLVNTYWQSNGLLLMKRTNRYFPRIEELLPKKRSRWISNISPWPKADWIMWSPLPVQPDSGRS